MQKNNFYFNYRFIVLVLLVLIFSFSCAYFNTLYNARKLYKEAEEIREKKGSERELREKYKEVVKKCAALINTYPDSRYIPDAIFLMGKALVQQGEYDKGIRKFFELKTNYPKSKYVPRSVYWTALAYYLKGDFNQAYAYATRFLKEYPEDDYKEKVLLLAGDIAKELDKINDALNFYAKLAESARNKETARIAVRKVADLFFEKQEWQKAAQRYERILKKGIPWDERYEISLFLGECYVRMSECEKALALYTDLLAKVPTMKEKPPVELGRAAAYQCMDSLESAIKVYQKVVQEFPSSKYSAEAYYRIGVIYHERLDSLELAKRAFEKVGKEYANSEFASIALQKSSSIKKLIELEKSTGAEKNIEKAAEKKFLSAEIQLTRLDNLEEAMKNYRVVVDSFPQTQYGPRAAYALAWIYQNKLNDTTEALNSYTRVVQMFPLSQQATGAIENIEKLGFRELAMKLSLFVDSLRSDTTLSLKEDSVVSRVKEILVDSTNVAPDSTIDNKERSLPEKPKEVVPAPDSSIADSLKRGR